MMVFNAKVKVADFTRKSKIAKYLKLKAQDLL